MAAKVLGIEIGERLTKICETNMGPGVRKVSGCIMFQTPPNAVSDGEIRDPEALASALKENLIRSGLKNRKVIFSVSSGRIAIREVTIPPVRDSRIKAIVEASASEYFPVDMSKYHITYTLQERKSTGDDAGCRLIVMAAPIAILEGYFKLATLLGFAVQALDYNGNSLFRMLETQHNEEVTMYVDINGTYSVTTVMKKNQLLMQRTFMSGVDDYVLAYMGGAGRDDTGYLETLRELNIDSTSPILSMPPAEELDENLTRLISNITRIVDYFNSSNWETPIEKLVLTGIGASVAGLKEAAGELTGLPVTVLTKLDRVSAPGNMTNSLMQYVSCLGCAINPVDFIPERFSKSKKNDAKSQKASATFGITVFAVCIIAALALSASSVFNYMTALEDKRLLEKKVADLAYTETVYNNYLMYTGYADSLKVLGDTIKSPNDELLAFINELERKMPEEVSILSASCTKESIAMNITVTSKTAAAKTIQQLRTFDSISNIIVGDITEIVDESGYTLVAFSVNCEYVVVSEQPADGAAPANETAPPKSDAADLG